MSFCDWLTVKSFHPYFKSKKMECLGIFPSEKTQLWLKNHRHLWKFTNNELKISFSVNQLNLPEITPLNESLELEFYLGVNDLNFQQYTEIEDSPIFYHQHHFNLEIETLENFPMLVNLNAGKILKTDKLISLPTGYQKLGSLKMVIHRPSNFFVRCISKISNEINMIADSKSYPLFYAVRGNVKNKKTPNLIDDESKNTFFKGENVDNSDFVFFKSDNSIKVHQLNDLECYSYWVSEDGTKTKLKVKTPNFSLRDLGKSPNYPHFPALLKEIKL
jgi:hypothetical protein